VIQHFVIAMTQDKAAIRFLDHDLADTKTSSFENSADGIPHVSQAERGDLAGATAAATQKRQMRSAKGALSTLAWGTAPGIRSHRKQALKARFIPVRWFPFQT